MNGDAKLNDKEMAILLAALVAMLLVGLFAGHQLGYQKGIEQSENTGYVTCSTINGSGAMCFTSGDVEFEWMENASTTTRNGTMNLRTINESVEG